MSWFNFLFYPYFTLTFTLTLPYLVPTCTSLALWGKSTHCLMYIGILALIRVKIKPTNCLYLQCW